jgi:hypothetical protein
LYVIVDGAIRVEKNVLGEIKELAVLEAGDMV